MSRVSHNIDTRGLLEGEIPLYCNSLMLTAYRIGRAHNLSGKTAISYNRDVSWNDGGSEWRSAGDLSADLAGGEQRRIHTSGVWA